MSPQIGLREPDEEVQALVTASAGLNLAVDFLPGSVGYDRSFGLMEEDADRIVWLDAYVANVDRSARNTNLLIWHRSLWAIDHGACLRFQHAWASGKDAFATSAYNYGDHVLNGVGRPRRVHDAMASQVTAELLSSILALVPDAWLMPDPDPPRPPRPVRRGAGPHDLRRLPPGAARRRGKLAAVRPTHAFQYAVLRAVPRVERGEFVNVGVILYCQDFEYLHAAAVVDEVRLRALDPEVDLDAVRMSAEAVVAACHEPLGSARENAGRATRFGMLTAPRSTVVQPSPVHAGVTDNPDRTLRNLLGKLVGPLR